MKDRLQLQTSEMSATILSAFYDIDMFYKQDKSLNMNTIHLNSMVDKKTVGAPVTANSCSYAPGFFRHNSTSSGSLDCVTNGNKYPVSSSYSSNVKESPVSAITSNTSASTAIMNKDNKFRERAYSENGERSAQLQALQQKPASQINSTRYKTELCRPFEENGACKYGEKCQFAHGYHELRSLSRHPKYKTEPCRTFHTIGFCPYGPRCHFIHNADERRPGPAPVPTPGPVSGPTQSNANLPVDVKSARDLCGYGHRDMSAAAAAFRDRPKLHHSLSFSGFSSHHGLESPLMESPTSRTPPPLSSSASSSSSSSSTASFYEQVLSPSTVTFPFPGQELKALLAPLSVHTHNNGYGNGNGNCNGSYYANFQSNVAPPSPPYNLSHLQSFPRLSESPVFDSPPSPPESLSDRESYGGGSLSSSGSLSGSESPSLDAGRRLPIFSRLSISDD